jgi:methionine sulfoxide reductase heme-binding subunit
LGLLPFVWIVWLTFANGLGPDPVKAIELRLGELGLQFLMASLAISPLRAGRAEPDPVSAGDWVARLLLCRDAFLTLGLALDMGLRWGDGIADLVEAALYHDRHGGLRAAAAAGADIDQRMRSSGWGAAAWGRLHRLTYVRRFWPGRCTS